MEALHVAMFLKANGCFLVYFHLFLYRFFFFFFPSDKLAGLFPVVGLLAERIVLLLVTVLDIYCFRWELPRERY